MLQLTDEKFVDDNYDVWVGDGTIVLTNWTDGHNHLYLYSIDKDHPAAATAKLERQLTSGDFEVGEVYNVDFKASKWNTRRMRATCWSSKYGRWLRWPSQAVERRRRLSYRQLRPARRQLCRQAIDAPDPPTLRLCQAAGKCNVFWQTRALESYHLRAPEQLEVKAHDGTTLYATLLLPEGSKRQPSQRAAHRESLRRPRPADGGQPLEHGLLFDELLAQHGFAVLHADNRGMAGRGRAFRRPPYHNFGPVQLEDQLTVVDAALAKYPQLDPKRLGWWGWSWGGTFTLYAMTHSDRFRAGVSVAPVTDWRNYDSIYTERYMSEPADFPRATRISPWSTRRPISRAGCCWRIGTGDDNVHIENTVQFVQKLIEAGIPYDLQILPAQNPFHLRGLMRGRISTTASWRSLSNT